jgi:Fe-S-cluster containining protein
MSQVEVARCTGHCCKDFTLPLSPLELNHQAARARLRKSRWNPEEILKVADMVIFLRTDNVAPQRPRGQRKVRGTKDQYKTATHHYTCRHHDTATGNCMNYENRPAMCSGYPYGRVCQYKACTRRCE